MTVMQYARSLVRSLSDIESWPSPKSARPVTEDWPEMGSMLHWDAFFDQAVVLTGD